MIQTLPIELTNGNDGRGHAFWRTNKRRADIELALQPYRRQPFACCVDITLTRVLGKGQRLWDADSVLRGNAKELIDSLVAVGWFVDDGPKWIRHVDGRQDATRRKDGPCTVIEITEV